MINDTASKMVRSTVSVSRITFKTLFLASALIVSATPALARDGWFDDQTDLSLESAPSVSASTTTTSSKPSGNQSVGLPTVSSGRPGNGGRAPGNLALKQLGKSTLPPTRLNSFVRQGGEDVYGGDGPLLPCFNKFTKERRIECGMKENPDLTTNHKISKPSAWDFPE